MLRALSQAQIDEIAANGRTLLQREREAAAGRAINVDNALALGQPVPLLWDGVEYSVRQISYRQGLQFQKAALEFRRWGEKPPETPEEIDAQEAFVQEVLDLMHGLLDPRPHDNPFADASPWEVGHLAAFFLTCQTKQRGRSRLRTGSSRLMM